MAASKPGTDFEAPSLGQSIIVELGLGAIGLALIVVSGHAISTAFQAPVQPVAALLAGLVLGGLLGGAFGLAMVHPAITARVRPFLSRFTSAAPTVPNLALIGIAAALGEETLFRAAIQPIAGIAVAAVLFTLAHSVIADLRHLTPGKLGYVALAFGMGIVLGVLYDRVGIAASMGTHAAFDFMALMVIRPLLLLRNDVPTVTTARS